MAKRYMADTEFSVDGTHVAITRAMSFGLTEIRVWRDWGNGEYRYLSGEGNWIECEQGESIPATFRMRFDVLEILKAALNEEETPAIAANALLADTLKREQSRVDQLIAHVLTNGGTVSE